jgi:hypothetical protein
VAHGGSPPDRSSDGQNLYACSSDGHVCVFTFELSELTTLAPPGTRENFHSTFNFPKPVRQRAAPAYKPVGTFAQPNVLGVRKAASVNVAAEQKISVVNGKKRIQPAFLGGLGTVSGGTVSSPQPQQQPQPQPPARPLLQPPYAPSSSYPQTSAFGVPQQGSSRDLDIASLDARMGANGVFGSHQLVCVVCLLLQLRQTAQDCLGRDTISVPVRLSGLLKGHLKL